MGKNGYKEQIRSFYDKSNQISDEEQWKKLGIDFYREVPKFPGNKIYAKINIEPESARKLIKHFILVVNDSDRCEFKSDYREISVSGFDVKDKDKITVKIKAFPFNKNWKIIESKPCTFTFSGKNIGHFDTTTSFDWTNGPKVMVLLKWNHIGDRIAQKYIVCLDNKEIQYINQLSIEDELSFYIHNLKPGENHTIEVIAKLNNGKETCRSDQIEFTIPKTKDEQNTEVLAVINEPAPPSLLATNDTNEDKKEEEPPPKDDRLKDRILELLRILEQQIANRRIRQQFIRDKFEIHIKNLTRDAKYTLEIAAKLNYGKETCRSDPIEFIVPTKKPDTPKTGSAGKAEANENVIITILNETIPYDLPVISKENVVKEGLDEPKPDEAQFHLQAKKLLELLELQIESRINCSQKSHSHLLHETFPGIEHYFIDDIN